MILKFTFLLKERKCRFVGGAGVELLIRIWSGEGWKGLV